MARIALLIGLVIACQLPGGRLFAQGQSGSDRSNSGPSPAEFLRWLDRNRNGTIEPNEIVGSYGARIKELARSNRDLDFSRPIPIERLMRAFSGASSSRSTPYSTPPSSDLEPLVPGFGTETEAPPVLGFGANDDLFSIEVSDQDRRTADDRFRRYDSNRDGYLSREELARNRWSDNPLMYDRNFDDRLSRDEMAVRYAYQRTRGETDRLMSFYTALDRNRNRILEPAEFATHRSRSDIERRIREAGFDPARPIPLNAFMSKRLDKAGVKSDQNQASRQRHRFPERLVRIRKVKRRRASAGRGGSVSDVL